MMPGSAWSREGLAAIIACISVITVDLILHFGPLYGLNTWL